MTRTLITGAAGFTGRYLAAALSAGGHHVHALVHEGDSSRIDGVDAVHHCDLTQAESTRDAVAAIAPDHVVHLAAIAFAAHRDVGEIYRTNILGTRHLLGALADLAMRPQSVLVASSANVYGHRAGRMDEAAPVTPFNDYGVTKAASELVCALFTDRLPLVTVRPFNYTGLGQSADFLIPKIVDHARRGVCRIELGNLDVARDISDVRMVVDAYQRLLECPQSPGKTFNICSGRATDLRDIVAMVSEIADHPFDIATNPAFVRAGEVRSLCGDPSFIERTIGPLNHIPLRQTLEWMLTN